MIKVSTTGMAVSLITDLRFPTPGQQGHGRRIIHFSLEMNFSLLLFRIKGIEFCLSIPNPKSKSLYHVSAIIRPKVKEIYLLYYLQPNSEYVQVIFAGSRFLIFTGNAILSNSFNSKQVFLINFLYLKILSLP